jgi:arylsulfatase A-like enzyme
MSRKTKNIGFAAAMLVILAIAGSLAALGCSGSKNLPNIILISVDTLRADRLGCYGYPLENATPTFNLFAENGVLFENAYASSPWTLPSHGSMFTGLYPSKHGAIDESIQLDKQLPLLTEKLKAAGYKTGGFVSHYYLSKDYGFDRGFDKFVMKLDAPASEITRMASRWIRDSRKKPFFAFLHYFDPHTPYNPPRKIKHQFYPEDLPEIKGDTRDVLSVIHTKDPVERDNMLRGLSALYDAEIDTVDRAVATLYEMLQLHKLDQDTMIIVTSDHGEEFFEHGLMEHGFTLYQEQLHVPLIVHCPATFPKGARVKTPVSLVDLMPMLMDYAGLRPPDNIDGVSFLSLARNAGTETPPPPQFEGRVLFAETTRQGPDRMAVIKEGHKYIYSPPFSLSGRSFDKELFNMTADPQELVNLVAQKPEMVQAYETLMTETGMYVQRRVWHVLFDGTDGDTRYNGRISTFNRIVYGYKNNVIYDTDAYRKMIFREFPWQKRDSMIRFVAFGQDGSNGFSFITDPPESKVNFYLYVNTEAEKKKILIGAKDVHPEEIPFTLQEDVEKTADAPPDGGYLVWTTKDWVNAKSLQQYEVGDRVQPSAEMKERLRTLGYLSGEGREMGKD